VQAPTATASRWRSFAIVAFQLAVILPTLALGFWLLARLPEPLPDEDDLRLVVLLWALLIGLVELLPVPVWRGLQVGVGFPLLIMVAILYPPGIAGLIALLGASDPREYRREVSFIRALFNRCQVSLSVMAASAVFHSLAVLTKDERSPLWVLLAAASLAAIADYVVNSSLVTVFVSMRVDLPIREVVRELRVGELSDFLISYLGLAILGLALAVVYLKVGPWSVPAFLAPLLLARQVFFRSQALEEAHTELQEREQVLKTLSNAMAEERADERLQIAGYLHDDLAQVLFRLSIQVDVARKLLEKDDIPAVRDQLDKIRESKQETSDRIRALIRDLHRSPLGAKGLADALESFTDEVGRDSGVEYHRDIEEMPLPAPIALLIFHIAREGVMNSLKHAHASDMWISVREQDDSIVLELRDNGVGFDTEAPGPEGHFGMAMMRERAQVGGGTFEVQSAPGEGATITVRFPSSLLQSETPGESGGDRDAAAADASPGTSGSTRGDDDYPRSVPA
jgi:signal transduction histidine kinase